MARLPTTDAQKVAALRELLPATGAGIYLDTATAGPLPAETAATMREADEWELRVGRAAAGREEDVAQREAEAQAVVAALIGADPAHVTLAAGPRQALISGLADLALRPGQRVAVDAANDEPIIAAARAYCAGIGASVDVVDGVKSRLADGTRALLLAHVAPATGELADVPAARAALAERDIALIVDGSWSVAAVPVAAADLGADLLFFAADRWALAPEGTAALWRRNVPAGGVSADRLPRTTLLGLARSVGWLAMYVALDWIYERGQRLAGRLAELLAAVDGVELLTPRAAMATIVTFRLPQPWTAEEAADELGRRVFAIVRPLPALNALRASVAWFNSEEELERFVGAVGELARHTPATLPRKPTLTVL